MKKAYESPKIEPMGNLVDLTKGGLGMGADASMGTRGNNNGGGSGSSGNNGGGRG